MTSLVQVTVENHEFYLDRILEIENLSFTAPWSLNGFLQELENPVSQLWALMSDKALLGYFCFWAVRDEMQLLNLAVHPAYRGRGHGSYLLTKMIDIALSRGVSRIWLEVRVSGTRGKTALREIRFRGRRPKKELLHRPAGGRHHHVPGAEQECRRKDSL